ncbi:cytidine deaminase [Bremerella cremea]|uniref:Cytidine deaminase n=1 Tax=Blastopirellula marina TaxID=124 RepID=A0A2S8FZG9_9BACT|nr:MULTISPECIES: anti-phage dCTP deaminase [Pirellulaceae]PQO37592.1 cytidine deaminase [Blastopirellula marina]RCS49979.1 cytidine deaminase [Bremerella cremea]
MAADLFSNFKDSELVLGLVGAVGAKLDETSVFLTNRLRALGYSVREIHVSSEVIPLFVDTSDIPESRGYERISQLMQAGNEARQKALDNSLLALGIATRIHRLRNQEDGRPAPKKRMAYIVRSLKRPEEVKRLREIYGTGFYLIAAHCDPGRREGRLTGYYDMSSEQAQDLIERDFDDKEQYGQRLNKTFSLADFFIRIDAVDQAEEETIKQEVLRLTNIMFGHPFTTPTFDEYAMYFAFAAALRSADLSRQVGAVIAKNSQVLSHGANDSPAYGGGLYWPIVEEGKVCEPDNGRDYNRTIATPSGEHTGYDSNRIERDRIIEGIVSKVPESDRSQLRELLKRSQIADLTEYGRVVHAEMEALLSCGRAGVSPLGGTLYSTTFPCHNCAKHIIAAGIERVVYIEPYPKSKALEFHDDSVHFGFQKVEKKVNFEPFVGVGPRRFFDLFSYRHGSGRDVERQQDGYALTWNESEASLKLQMSPFSYLELEQLALKQIQIHELQGRENHE